MAFLHGVETIELVVGGRTITVVKSAVIALVGIAPKGAINSPILVTSDNDLSQFGALLPGFTIPQALSAIYSKGPNHAIIVVNVFDPATDTAQVTAEVLAAVSGRKTKTAFSPIPGQAFVLTSNDGVTTYVRDTDFTMDDFGNIVILANTIAEGALPKATYKKLDIAQITNNDIIGAVDGTTDARSGLKCFDLAFTKWGFNPKIFIAPGFSSVNAIGVQLTAVAKKFRAITFLDAPKATTPSVAFAGRGPGGSINFNVADNRTELLFPMLKALDGQGVDSVDYFSSHLAGVRSVIDQNPAEGFHVSHSNHVIDGITGVEREISASISDVNSQTNQLNAQGIVTYFNAYGTGIRAWGNRNSSYPQNTDPLSFTCIRRTADIIEESVELAQLPYIDQPLSMGIIDAVRENVNTLYRTLIGRGALIDGVCTYSPADNPVEELAAGHVTYRQNFMPPPPMERVSLKTTIDISLLKKLTASSAA